MKAPNEEVTREELTIHSESIFALERTIKDQPKKEADYHRWYAQANKKVNDLTLELEILVATITDEICRAENISPSARPEVRRSRVALDKRYKVKKEELNKAIENKEILDGLTRAWNSRGFRLTDLTEIAKWTQLREPKMFDREDKFISAEDRIRKSTENMEID